MFLQNPASLYYKTTWCQYNEVKNLNSEFRFQIQALVWLDFRNMIINFNIIYDS